MGDYVNDKNVQLTNDDATLSKMACAKLGYTQDHFVRYFTRPFAKRPPLINRGYYARIAAIRQLMAQFLQVCSAT